jgi:hypothetical protein
LDFFKQASAAGLRTLQDIIFLYLIIKISDWYRVDTRVWGARSEKIRGLSRGEER